MKNSVIAQVNYSFKGENFTPSITLELDVFAKQHSNFSSLYPRIAQQNNIDTYSYAYEVMEASAIIFHTPTGNVVDFIIDGKCNLAAYQEYLKEAEMLIALEKIAADVLGINDLSAKDNKELKEALSRAYNAGIGQS
jgi:hypothetical protein